MNNDLRINRDEEYTMPCAEAMLAGTLALMTGHVQACCAGQRDLIAKKIVSNLLSLAEHPQLSASFKSMLSNLRVRWLVVKIQDAQAVSGTESDQKLWHGSPDVVQ